LVFFCLIKLLFSGFLPFKGNFVCNLTIKHCDKTKVKTITVKNSKKRRVKMNKKTLFEYKCTKEILRD